MPEAFRDPSLQIASSLRIPLLGIRCIDEVEVAALDPSQVRHLALVDSMCIGDDAALGGLAEDLGQKHHRHGARDNDVGQNLPRPHGGELIGIADEQQRRRCRQSAEHSAHQRYVDHRDLVDDQQITVERRLLVAPKAAGSWVGFLQAMDHRRLEPGAQTGVSWHAR
jgi:hypothetical protein